MFVADCVRLSSLIFFGAGCKITCILTLAVQGHPRTINDPGPGSLILVRIDSAYAFLLVRHSNLGHILHSFRDILYVSGSEIDSHPYPSEFGPDRRCWGQPEREP